MCVRGSIDRRVPVHTVGENKNDNDEHVDQHTSDSKRRRREWHAKCGGGGHENSSNNKKNNNTEREKSRAHKRMIYVELIQLVFVIEKKKN